jgi:hypothetical protein
VLWVIKNGQSFFFILCCYSASVYNIWLYEVCLVFIAEFQLVCKYFKDFLQTKNLIDSHIFKFSEIEPKHSNVKPKSTKTIIRGEEPNIIPLLFRAYSIKPKTKGEVISIINLTIYL